MDLLEHQVYKIIFSVKKIDFYIGFKDSNILVVDSNPRISVSRNISIFIREVILVKICVH